jgi:hypothetical protein
LLLLSSCRRAQEIEPGYCEPSYWIALTRVNQGDVLPGLAAMKASLCWQASVTFNHPAKTKWLAPAVRLLCTKLLHPQLLRVLPFWITLSPHLAGVHKRSSWDTVNLPC